LFVLTVLKQDGEMDGVVGTPELVFLVEQVGEAGPVTQRYGRFGQVFQLVQHVTLQKRVIKAVEVVFRFTR
jgi:hypothetical protein